MRCEYCSKEHDGKYGSGRFCCQECARGFSTKAKRKEINKKVSNTLKNKDWFSLHYVKGSEEYKEAVRRRVNKYKETVAKRQYSVNYIVGGDRLDISKGDLKDYRKQHTVCEICGREETADTAKTGRANRLTVDHNHDSKHFRGLLCQSCNRMLGWYENQYENIEQYLQTHDPEWRNGKRS